MKGERQKREDNRAELKLCDLQPLPFNLKKNRQKNTLFSFFFLSFFYFMKPLAVRNSSLVNMAAFVVVVAGMKDAVPLVVGLSLQGLDYAIMWGVVAFLLNFIPNIGSIIAAIPQLCSFPMSRLAGEQHFRYRHHLPCCKYCYWKYCGAAPRVMGKGVGLPVLVVFLLFQSLFFLLYNPIFLTLHLSYDDNKLREYIIRIGRFFRSASLTSQSGSCYFP